MIRDTFSSKAILKHLKNGFNANIIGIPYDVIYQAKLTTYRASSPYKNGTLFLDKSTQYDKVDYEIEYEVDDDKEGLVDFKEFLAKYQIEYN